jgi:hypothetical protein
MVGLVTFDAAVRLSRVLKGDFSIWLVLIACGELIASTTSLWITVSRWAGRAAPLMFLAAIRSLISLFTGTMISSRHEPIPRTESVLAFAYFIIGGALTMRYTSLRPNRREGLGLVTFIVFSLPIALLPTDPLLVIGSATAGITALGITRMTNHR